MWRALILIVLTLSCCLSVQAGGDEGDDDRVEALISAARQGDVKRIRRLLASGVDVNAVSDFNRTALYSAVASDGLPAVRELLRARADPNLKRPLITAIGRNQLAIARALAAAGADVNGRDEEGESPLMLARSAEAVRFLHDAGASLEARDRRDRTPLMHAVTRGGRIEVARALLLRKANVNQGLEQGDTALHHAVGLSGSGSREIVQLLIDHGASLSAQNYPGETALILALQNSSRLAAQELLAAVTDLHIADRKGKTALHYAAKAWWPGSGGIMQILIDRGASLAARDRKGNTPLHAAMGACTTDKFKRLRGAGARLDLSDADDLETFYRFAGCGTSEAIRLVLEYSGVPDRQKMLSNAYFGAIWRHEPEAIEMVFAAGLSPDTVIRYNFDPPEFEPALVYAIAQPDARPEVVALLVKHGVSLEARGSRGRTALMHAAERDRLGFARALLVAGADPNAQDDNGYTALMHSVDQYPTICSGDTSMVTLLLEYRANVALRNKSGNTARAMVPQLNCMRTVGSGNNRRMMRIGPGVEPIIEVLRRAE